MDTKTNKAAMRTEQSMNCNTENDMVDQNGSCLAHGANRDEAENKHDNLTLTAEEVDVNGSSAENDASNASAPKAVHPSLPTVILLDTIVPRPEDIHKQLRGMKPKLSLADVTRIVDLIEQGIVKNMPQPLKEQVELAAKKTIDYSTPYVLGNYNYAIEELISEEVVRLGQKREKELMAEKLEFIEQRLKNIRWWAEREDLTPRQVELRLSKWRRIFRWEARFECMCEMQEELEALILKLNEEWPERLIRQGSWPVILPLYASDDDEEEEDMYMRYRSWVEAEYKNAGMSK